MCWGPVAHGSHRRAASVQVTTASLSKLFRGGGSAAHIRGANPWQIRWGEGSGDKFLPSSSLRGCVLSQACGWAGAGVALIAFSLCWPPALRRLLFNEENSLRH